MSYIIIELPDHITHEAVQQNLIPLNTLRVANRVTVVAKDWRQNAQTLRVLKDRG